MKKNIQIYKGQRWHIEN